MTENINLLVGLCNHAKNNIMEQGVIFMAMANEANKPINNNSPWLIFEIKNVLYALNCAKIQSIMKKPEEDHSSTYLPDAPDYIRSMVRIRENVVPTLDLRRLYDITSVAEEYEAFKITIDQRKADHINWIGALEKSIKENSEFKLARDPHQCAFGKWYYHYHAENQVVDFMLRKIEEPHRKLHELADQVLACSQKHDECTRKECVKQAFLAGKTKLMPQLLALLDEVKEVFHHRYQEKLIVVEEGDRRIAVIVDDVKAIDQLEDVDGQEEFSELMQNRYIYSVGRGKKIDDIILMIKAEELLALVKQGKGGAE